MDRGKGAAARRPSPVRLLVLLAVAGAVFLLSSTRVEAEVPSSAKVDERIVKPGDTLWGIASDIVDPGEDVRPMVSFLRKVNDLDSAAIHPGQRLLVPD